jgi:hypothetical protein
VANRWPQIAGIAAFRIKNDFRFLPAHPPDNMQKMNITKRVKVKMKTRLNA